jgi:hypothetical protein
VVQQEQHLRLAWALGQGPTGCCLTAGVVPGGTAAAGAGILQQQLLLRLAAAVGVGH